MLRNDYETRSLKTLALLVLERNRKRNSDETGNVNHVSLSQSALKQEGLRVTQEKYKYLYEERLAICQFDGGLNKEEARLEALNDVKKLYQNKNSETLEEFISEFKEANCTIQ